MFGQALADGILTGAILSLGAIGITLCLTILRFANFAHSELMTWGAYFAFTFTSLGLMGSPLGPLTFGWGFLLATLIAGALTACLALVVDRTVFRRLRNKNATRLTLIFASFGVALVLRHVVVLIFGPQVEYYSRELQMAVLLLPGVRVMPDQFFVLGLTVALVVLLQLFLTHTRLGLAMRATAESPMLAQVSGIEVTHVIAWTWVVAGLLAAAGGVFFGLTVQMRPEMGFNLLLAVFAASIIGGSGSLFGAVLGGLIVGLSENLATLVVPTSYKQAVPFLLLVVILYFRPQGLIAAKT
ncbi:MAG: branched-chain amino acid ABC transporter permease [Alphaproteobacteria bacterium]|nr:branched-chain amino acid ABC transporter permease [Alphaproteobacteria bacterium]